MKTISEIAGSITLRYGREEFEGDELDMVRAAVTAALEEDRANIINALEDEKVPVIPTGPNRTSETEMARNASYYIAQSLIREAD